MIARALLALNGPDGNWHPGQIIRDVGEATLRAWIAAGAAEEVLEPEASEASTAEASTVDVDAALEALSYADVRALALSLGLKGSGKKSDLAAAIRAARAIAGG